MFYLKNEVSFDIIFFKESVMEKEISFVMIKPGFLKYEKEIVKRLSKVGKITKRQEMRLNQEILNDHYAEHIGKDFFNELCAYMKSGNVVGFQVEGEAGLIGRIRDIVGRNPLKEGDIRYDFGLRNKNGELDKTKNVVHASDKPEAGISECNRMFNEAQKYGVEIISRGIKQDYCQE